MKIINLRSPYIISINYPNQIETRLELRIWKQSDGRPTQPTYSFTKSIPSVHDIETIYNIANFAKDFITPDDKFVNVEVQKYYKVTSYTLGSTEQFIAVNGYSDYFGGANQFKDGDEYHRLSPIVNQKYIKKGLSYIYTYDLYFPTNIADYTLQSIVNGVTTTLPITAGIHSYDFPNASKVIVLKNGVKIDEFTFTEICEPILETSLVQFVNRNGVIEFLDLFKMQTRSIETTSTDFSRLQSSWNYNSQDGIRGKFNFNGKEKVRVNTGFVPEVYSELIKDLMLSERIILDGKPVNLTTSSTELKTVLKDKLINYELEFEYSFDLINNVI